MNPLADWLGGALTPTLAAVIAGTFVLGGIVKGTLGVGLPLVVVPLLSLVLPTPTSIRLVAIPVLASNLWQAWDTRVEQARMKRFVPLIAALVLTTLLSVPVTLALTAKMLDAMLSVAVLTAVALMAFKPTFRIPEQHVGRWGAVVGGISGILGGVSSLTGPIIIGYLMALNLGREQFVRTISIVYLCSALPLYASMAFWGRFGLAEVALSTLALAPLGAGMAIGKQLRGRLSEVLFRRVLLLFLTAVALLLLFK